MKKIVIIFFVILIISCATNPSELTAQSNTATVENERLVLISYSLESTGNNTSYDIQFNYDYPLVNLNNNISRHSSLTRLIYNTLYRTNTANEYLRGIINRMTMPPSYYADMFGGDFQGISFEVIEKKGKYLIINEIHNYIGGSSVTTTDTHIFDTEAIRLITKNDIFTDVRNSSFRELLLRYLSRIQGNDTLDRRLFNSSLDENSFSINYAPNGIVFIFDLGTPWNWLITIPYSELRQFLTPVGREIFGG